MCTLLIANKMHPKFPFIYLGNRDEFKSRPTKGADFSKNIIMGQDLKAGGTWMGISKTGRFACLTNYRDMTIKEDHETSRGHLVSYFLDSDLSTMDFMSYLKTTRLSYKGYNIIFGTLDNLYYYNNIKDISEKLGQGIYGLSNGVLNEAWPKVVTTKQTLIDYLYDDSIDSDGLFSILKNNQTYTENLPFTGLSHDDEISLSALHVNLSHYGTVMKQVIILDQDLHYYEKSIADNFKETRHYKFEVDYE